MFSKSFVKCSRLLVLVTVSMCLSVCVFVCLSVCFYLLAIVYFFDSFYNLSPVLEKNA